MNVFVFGDTGGHFSPLLSSLRKIGVDTTDTLNIPDGIQIIHLGDLIHKGIHSNDLVEIVDSLIRKNPGQYIQLLGNHEFQHIKGAPIFWRCDCNAKTVSIINKWYNEGLAVPSYYLSAPVVFNVPKSLRFDTNLIKDKDILFSHAGLTHDFWGHIGSPKTAKLASERLNKLSVRDVTIPGMMLAGGSPHGPVGPVWALSTSEVFASWTQEGVISPPFVQINGHSPAYQWQRKVWHAGTPLQFKKRTKLDVENRIMYTSVQDSLQLCLDPGFGINYDLRNQTYLEITM
jgi:hypothetical protein